MASLIAKDDESYEQQLIKDPYDIDVWLQYYKHKLSQPDHTVENLVFILCRALQYVSRSYKIWMMYLELKIENKVKGIVRSFEVAKEHLGKFPKFWLMYLSYLRDCQDLGFVKYKFDECLKSVPIPLHLNIWPLYLEFADKVRDYKIFKRFLMFKIAFNDVETKYQYENILDKLIKYSTKDNLQDLIKVFAQFMTNESIIVTLESEFDIYWKYINILIKYKSELVDDVVKKAISKFPDQRDKLVIELAHYYTDCKDLTKLKSVYDQGISESTTIRDFTTIYEDYLEFEEKVITKLMDTESAELDTHMANFEKLMNEREFMINDIYLKQDPNNVDTWLQRIAIWDEKTQLKEILETYVKLIMTINPKKVSKGLYRIWLGYMKVYETNGDLTTARNILGKCVSVPFNDVNDLVEVWLEWSNLELRNDDIDALVKVLETPLTVGDTKDIDFHDESIPVQQRVFKSFKLWSFYVDLVESTEDVEKTSEVYEKMILLKIAKPITLINYASFFEENHMYERSLAIFEKGLKIFKYPIVYEIWNIYLSKIIKFLNQVNISQERIRDLFDECIKKCPLNNIHSIIIMYANFEEINGNLTKMFKIYDENTSNLEPKSKIIIYKLYLTKALEYLDNNELRKIYQKIINDDQLPLTRDLLQFVIDFVSLEVKSHDLERARIILKHFFEIFSESKQVLLLVELENFWKLLELQNGDEDTFKEMLRFKRICQIKFGKNGTDTVLEGFVKSSEGPKVSSIDASQTAVTNPDAIDIEIDSSDSDE